MSIITKFSSNAVLAKARAMYGSALTQEDYAQLLNCRTINELVNYLKNHTIYADTLSTLSPANISRSRVEARIKQFSYQQISKLASFEDGIGQHINEIIYLNYDLMLILSCANHPGTKRISDYSMFSPPALAKHSKVNPLVLEKTEDINQLYKALDSTPYKKCLEGLLSDDSQAGSLELENSLYTYMCSEIKRILKENYSEEEQKELLSFFKMKSDLKMVESIYRRKQHFTGEQITLSNIFYSGLSAFTMKEIESFINAKDIDELFTLLKSTVYGSFLDEKYKYSVEKLALTAQLRINEKNIRFSTNPELVMLSYIGILKNETKNLIHIIEGIRYSLQSDEITKYLVSTKESVS